jgi:nickel-dependent lactate racemase
LPQAHADRVAEVQAVIGSDVTAVVEKSRGLTEDEVRTALRHGLAAFDLAGARFLVVIPDGTRTAPIPLMFRLLGEILGPEVEALDYLIALGTHPPMDDAAKTKLLGTSVVDGMAGGSRVFNHRWEKPETFVNLAVISGDDVARVTEGRMAVEIPVRLNRLLGQPGSESPCDHILVCGPVFPHEVAGFSGGNKYFVPGVAGQEIIDITHWVGALMMSRHIIGVAETPVRQLIDLASAMIPTPRSLIAMVMHGEALHGLFIGEMERAWREATDLSAELDIVWVERPFQRVLSVMPQMYDDLWTGAKGMYKVEPAIADGGEVVIYAPHITEVSYVHGRHLDEVGYHVRDYFTAQWERFEHIPWGVLAHSTHLRGDGSFVDGVERPRIRVTLATGIPKERCERIGLGYMDPRDVDLDDWKGREEEDILFVPRAGEQLYRLKDGG